MTAAQAVETIDRLKENMIGREDKLRWLSELDNNLMNIVFKNHEECPYEDFDPNDTEDRTLLVPDPYSELYMAYLAYKIDFWNGEYERYNNSAILYNTQLQEFVSHWKREHLPLQKHQVKMG